MSPLSAAAMTITSSRRPVAAGAPITSSVTNSNPLPSQEAELASSTTSARRSHQHVAADAGSGHEDQQQQQQQHPASPIATTVLSDSEIMINNHHHHHLPSAAVKTSMRKSVSADDLCLGGGGGVTLTTADAEDDDHDVDDDDNASVYSCASDWVRAAFFPATTTTTTTTTKKNKSALSSSSSSPMDELDAIANLNVILDDHHGDDHDDRSTTSSSGGSVHTMRYFEPSDFHVETWEDLSAAQIGLAMVAAGGFFCFHPIVFVAGVLTAFGTLQAAGATYNYCENYYSSSSLLFCGGRNNDTTTTAAAAGGKVLSTNAAAAAAAGQAPTGPTQVEEKKYDDNALFDNDDDDDDDEEMDEGTDPMRQVSQITFSEDSGNLLLLPQQQQKLIQETATLESKNDPNAAAAPLRSGANRNAGIHSSFSSLTQLETQEALQWVDDFYPSLPTKALDRIEFHGLNAKEFFNVFFSDDAPFGFEAFHKIRKDKNIRYGQWEKLEGVQKPCLLSQAPAIAGGPTDDVNVPQLQLPPVQERLVQFDAKTGSFMGPPFAKTTKVQRALQISKRLLVLEMKTTLSDIPFSNRFYIMERWLVTSESHPEVEGRQTSDKKKHQKEHQKHGGKMTSTAFLTITSQVVFTQTCAFEATILKESAKQISEISTQWNKMAQEGLKRTEEARRQRLKEKELEEQEEKAKKADSPTAGAASVPKGNDQNATGDYENDESIEIQHFGRRNSWVAGEPYSPPLEEEEEEELTTKDLSLNARFSTRRRKSGRRSISRSLTNLIARRRSSTGAAAMGTPVSLTGTMPTPLVTIP